MSHPNQGPKWHWRQRCDKQEFLPSHLLIIIGHWGFLQGVGCKLGVLGQPQKPQCRKSGKRTFPPKELNVKKILSIPFFLSNFKSKTHDIPSYTSEEVSTTKPKHERGHHTKEFLSNGLRAIHTIDTCFRRVVRYRTYRLANKSLRHDQKVSKSFSKMPKRMMAQMKPRTFDLFVPILAVEFWTNFRMACDTNEIHERTAMWLVPLLKKSGLFRTTTTVSIRLRNQHESETKTRDNHAHCLSANNKVAVANIRERRKHCRHQGRNLYVFSTLGRGRGTVFRKAVHKDAPMWECLCKTRFNETFLKDPNKSIRLSMRRYWSSKKLATLQELAFCVTSFLKLRGEGQSSAQDYWIRNKDQNRRTDRQNRWSMVNVVTLSKTTTKPTGNQFGVDSK